MKRLLLVRHGQSQWNLENRFTGWMDVDLSPKGIEEARAAGEAIRTSGVLPNACLTSYLRRAIKTAWIALDTLDRLWIPFTQDWRLNERHYGGLQGLNKKETAEKYGDEQVHIWRRSFDVQPPALKKDDERHPSRDERYKRAPGAEQSTAFLHGTESLKDTIARMDPCWKEVIAPSVNRHDTILIAAHGNSLRALVKKLDGISNEDIMKLEIPTGQPLLYELDSQLKPTSRKYLNGKSLF